MRSSGGGRGSELSVLKPHCVSPMSRATFASGTERMLSPRVPIAKIILDGVLRCWLLNPVKAAVTNPGPGTCCTD